MQWFPGNVNTAIQVSRKNKALLIVYIETDDEKGRQFNALWDDVQQQNLPCSVVGIKLKKNDASAQQFAEIYPTPILPAAYLIDQTGKPLEVITHLIGLNNDTFRARFNRAIAEFQKSTPSSVPVQPSTPQSPQVDEQRQQSQQNEIEIETAERAAREEKVKRAKQLLEEKKKLDAMEKLKEKQGSIPAREETKVDRDEKALVEAAKERARQKLEAEKDRQRVKESIKADRENLEQRRKTQNAEKSSESVPAKSQEEGEKLFKPIPSDRCRVQVRMPDGINIVEDFPSSDHLQILVDIIVEKLNSKNFDLSQIYPHRVFNSEDFGKSFLENGLTPSSILVVRQKDVIKSVYKATTSSLDSYLWFLKSPFAFFFNFFASIFGGWGGDSKKNDGENGASTSAGPRPRGMPRSAEVRRRGNIAGLHNTNDDDPEEKSTFNGNSTQNM